MRKAYSYPCMVSVVGPTVTFLECFYSFNCPKYLNFVSFSLLNSVISVLLSSGNVGIVSSTLMPCGPDIDIITLCVR